MRLKKIFWLIIIFSFLGGGAFLGFKIYQDMHAWKVEIAIEFINIREEHNLYSNKLGTVYEGEKYKVLEIYLDDQRYVWYKIKATNDIVGWISSGRNNPYVKELNNPNVDEATYSDETYELDYKKPVVKFKDNVYVVYDINSINYDHLTIEEDSEYKIEHKVYYEEHPKDTDIPQYWIQYIVTDAAGNQTKKVQKIEFDIEPKPEEVLDFANLER